MPHDEITKDPRTVSALTGLPLADVLDTETCERCGESGRALQIRTYHVNGRVRRLCRPCSDDAAYEAAERSRHQRARVELERAYADALAAGAGSGGAGSRRLTPDDFAPGCDAYDRYYDL